MPNWCFNELEVTGDKKELQEFAEKVKTEDQALSFATLFPEPDYTKVKVKHTFPTLHEDTYADPESAWWDWRIQNWGTKWLVDEVEFVAEKDTLLYAFDTAWSPPIGWLEHVYPMFPKLKFKMDFEEPGMCFRGVCIADKDGFEVIDYEWEETADDLSEE